MKTKAPEPTFEIRFVARGLVPEDIPLHAVSDALSAVQDIASGRDPFETRQVPPERSIGLLKVRRGSAVYSCVARTPDDARANLTRVGTMLANLNGASSEGDLMATAFRPIETLSAVARAIGCRLEIYPTKARKSPLLVIEEGDFQRISERLLFTGETTVIGQVVRVGGATGKRCLMRIPGRHRLLYCDIADNDDNERLVKRLGEKLYEQVVASGTATWIHKSWYIYRFTIANFTQPKMGDPKKAIQRLRDAGLSAWDDIPNPDAYVRETRQ